MHDDLIDSDPLPGSLADFYRLNPKIKERVDLLNEDLETARFVLQAAARRQDELRVERDAKRAALQRHDAQYTHVLNDLDEDGLRQAGASNLIINTGGVQ